MDTNIDALYSELRTTRMELIASLADKNRSPLIKPLIQAELTDIECTLKKLERGDFGICELSGEMMPMDLLRNIPTLKSVNDYTKMDGYYRKGLYE